MMAWATCTPWGANSLAIDRLRARMPYFEVLKEDIFALDFTEAVAPVKMRVGGWEPEDVWERRRGRADWEKRKAPLLY